MPFTKNIKIIAALLVVVAIGAITYFYYPLAFDKNRNETVVIENCSSVEPKNLIVPPGKPAYLKNNDSRDHTVKIAESEFVLGSGEKKELSTEFTYGPGTYVLDCDGAEAGTIQISAPEQNLRGTESNFKQFYDSLSKGAQDCVKKVVGKDFDAAYKEDGGAALDTKYQGDINDCLKSPQLEEKASQ